MTPIKPGTAQRLGLRKPEPPVLWHVTVGLGAECRTLPAATLTQAEFTQFRRDVAASGITSCIQYLDHA